MKPVHLGDVDRGFAAGVNAAKLGRLNPFELALAAQIGLKLGEDTQHVEEGFAGGSGGIDRLFRRTQGHTAPFQIMNNVLQIFHRSSEPIDTCDHQGVAGTQKFEKDGEFGSAVTARTAFLLGPDDSATRTAKGSFLD